MFIYRNHRQFPTFPLCLRFVGVIPGGQIRGGKLKNISELFGIHLIFRSDLCRCTKLWNRVLSIAASRITARPGIFSLDNLFLRFKNPFRIRKIKDFLSFFFNLNLLSLRYLKMPVAYYESSSVTTEQFEGNTKRLANAQFI